MSTNTGVSNYQNMLLQVYGTIGDWRDSIKLDEFDIYGASRLGTYVVDSTHVIKDYDGAFITTNGSATITTTYYSFNETVSTKKKERGYDEREGKLFELNKGALL